MGSSLPVLTRTAKEADEGVAIPRCALMASSSLEVLENSSVITFSSDRQRGSMVHRPPGHPQSFIRYWTLCWCYVDNPRKSCRMQINYAPFNAPWGVKLFHRLARWYKFFVRILRFRCEAVDSFYFIARSLYRMRCAMLRLILEVLSYIKVTFMLINI